jgi:hypothetical protein
MDPCARKSVLRAAAAERPRSIMRTDNLSNRTQWPKFLHEMEK